MINIYVIGSNFAGSTAALEIQRKLKKTNRDYCITVVSPHDQFLYVPSLIWVPFGKRKVSEISFPVSPVFKKFGINYLQDRALKINPESNSFETEKNGVLKYDYIVIASGVSLNENAVPGYHFVENIVTPPLAEKCNLKFQELIKNPGPVVVGATQGASCMGAAYEYLFNMEKELRRHGVREKVNLTWITPEPELGHFGIGGIKGGETMLKTFMKMYNINYRTNAKIDRIEKDRIIMSEGEELPYSMSMLIPPFEGAGVMKNSHDLVDEKGFVECFDTYQSIKYENVFVAGLAVKVKSPFANTKVNFGVPKTGYPSDVQGKIVAHNLVEKIIGGKNFKEKAFGKIPGICIMDAGHKEVWILTDHLFKPRKFEIMIPNVIINVGKILLEKYMIFKNRHGLSYLP
jgi:sulfide:quinone oxidoreductase